MFWILGSLPQTCFTDDVDDNFQEEEGDTAFQDVKTRLESLISIVYERTYQKQPGSGFDEHTLTLPSFRFVKLVTSTQQLIGL